MGSWMFTVMFFLLMGSMCWVSLGQTTNGTYKITVSDYNGSIQLSDNTIYEASEISYDIRDSWSIFVSNVTSYDTLSNIEEIDNYLYNQSNFSFDWLRSERMRVIGLVSKLNFKALYSEKLGIKRNENNFIDANLDDLGHLYDYCQSPIPYEYSMDIYSQWVESGLDNYGNSKTQGSTCDDSGASFWSDDYTLMCDSATTYLSSLSAQYVKIFECRSNDNSNGNMDSYEWYYDPIQLEYYGGFAGHVKFVVYDRTNGIEYQVISNDESYATTNLAYTRSLSHLFYTPINSTVTSEALCDGLYADINNTWSGSQDLINSMYFDCDYIVTIDDGINGTENYDLSDYIFKNDYNGFNIDILNGICSAFNSDNSESYNSIIDIELYFDIGLFSISTGYMTDPSVDGIDFDGNSFEIYSYGNTDPLDLMWYATDQSFSINDLSPGNLYTLTFDYEIDSCLNDGGIGVMVARVTTEIETNTTTNESTTHEIYEEIYRIGGDNGDNGDKTSGNVSYTFLADNSEHIYKFVLLNISNSTDACFIDIPYIDILKCQDVSYCNETITDCDSGTEIVVVNEVGQNICLDCIGGNINVEYNDNFIAIYDPSGTSLGGLNWTEAKDWCYKRLGRCVCQICLTQKKSKRRKPQTNKKTRKFSAKTHRNLCNFLYFYFVFFVISMFVDKLIF